METIGRYTYRKEDEIGNGAFGRVYKGRCSATSEIVAVKRINVEGSLSSVESAQLQKEVLILKTLDHANIVKFIDYHEETPHIFVVMEFCNGGNLEAYIRNHKERKLPEISIAILLENIIPAMIYLTTQEIIHRDLKPENILICYVDNKSSGAVKQVENVTFKLADFGVARHLSGGDLASTFLGSLPYMAPELFISVRPQYDSKVDIWSLGIIIAKCILGRLPFNVGLQLLQYLRNLYKGNPRLKPNIPLEISHHLKDLVLGMMEMNPTKRYNLHEIATHPFIIQSQVIFDAAHDIYRSCRVPGRIVGVPSELKGKDFRVYGGYNKEMVITVPQAALLTGKEAKKLVFYSVGADSCLHRLPGRRHLLSDICGITPCLGENYAVYGGVWGGFCVLFSADMTRQTILPPLPDEARLNWAGDKDSLVAVDWETGDVWVYREGSGGEGGGMQLACEGALEKQSELRALHQHTLLSSGSDASTLHSTSFTDSTFTRVQERREWSCGETTWAATLLQLSSRKTVAVARIQYFLQILSFPQLEPIGALTLDGFLLCQLISVDPSIGSATIHVATNQGNTFLMIIDIDKCCTPLDTDNPSSG